MTATASSFLSPTWRSLLYVPANIEKFVAKAHQRGADACILDLEDAIIETQKDNARAALGSAVLQVRQSGADVLVRLNSGPRRDADLHAAVDAGADAVMLPKVQSAGEIDELIAIAGKPDLKVIALIENVAGMLNAHAIAVHPNVCALTLGAEDFATSTGAKADADVIRLPVLLVHYAAKAEQKLSLGLLRTAIQFDDAEALQAAAREAARFGFDGASCIHPSAVATLNAAFSPSCEEIAHARRVIDAAAAAAAQGKGAFLLGCDFIDAPIIARAHRLLAKAGIMP